MSPEPERQHLYNCTQPSNHRGPCDVPIVVARHENPCYPASANLAYYELGGMCPTCGHLVALHSMRRACAACELLTIGPTADGR